MVTFEPRRTTSGHQTYGLNTKNRQGFRANGENTNDFLAKENDRVCLCSEEQDRLAGARRVFSGQRAVSVQPSCRKRTATNETGGNNE